MQTSSRVFWIQLTLICGLLVVGSAPSVADQEAPPPPSAGRATAHRAGGLTVHSSRLAKQAPIAALYGIGRQAGEPTLGVTSKGTVFYTAIQYNTRIDVVASTDEGASWNVVSPEIGGQDSHLLSFDPYLYVDEDTDRVFTVDLTVACSHLSFTDDGGETWTTNPLACGRPVNDHQTLSSGPPATSKTDDYPNVVYYCYNGQFEGRCSKSLDGGITFLPTGDPAYPAMESGAPNGGLCEGIHGHVVVGRDGTVYLPQERCDEPWLSISRDEGATWKRVRVSDMGHPSAGIGGDPSVAVDEEGIVYYAWIAEDLLPYLSISRDRGSTWSAPMMISAPGVVEANLPSIDVGASGKVAIVYMGREQGADWNGYMTISDEVLNDDPLFYSGSVNDPSHPLVVGDCGPGRCQGVLDFIDVVISHDGTPWGSFVDTCTPECRDAPDGAGLVARFLGGPSLN